MTVDFYKYHGTGNDFILIDDRAEELSADVHGLFGKLCDRRFGIGADGLMLLRNSNVADFEMLYYNADGKPSTMCGNGGRCIVHFANYLGMVVTSCTFMAVDGLHQAKLIDGLVHLEMIAVKNIKELNGDYELDTGSPHYIKYVSDVEQYQVFEEGRGIRNSEAYKTEGINVNFLEWKNKELFVRTYERGVEDETYSCGTGVTAAALAHAERVRLGDAIKVQINTLGGNLEVRAERSGEGFNNIWLIGPAVQVYQGKVETEGL